MKQLVLTLAMVATLAACGSGQEPQKDGEATPPAQQAPASSSTPASVEKGIDILTGLGFTPDFAYSVVYDMTDKNSEGVNRHRVLLEVMEGSVTEAMERAEASLASAGYAKAKQTEGDGRYDAVFTKQGEPTLVFMAQTAERGPALKNQGAVGTIHIMWNFY